MQTFSALLGSNAANAPSSRTSSSSGAQDDRGDAGGFDRLMQSQSRDDARANASKQPSPRAQEHERARDPSGTRKTDEAGKRDASGPEASGRGADEPRRIEAKDTDGASRESDANDESAGGDTAGSTAMPTEGAADTVPPADASAPASLPEQLLALLNGLAAAPAATSTAPADAATTALPAGTAAPAPAGAAKPLLPLQPAATAVDAPPAANDAAANAFALAVGAAAGADAATDTAMDTAETPEVSSPPLSVSTATVHPLSRATAAAVQANQPLSVDAGFEDGFGSRIAWLAEQKIGHAEIRVTPDHLGTIDVRLQLDGTRVNAEFHSAQADVRQALESSLPRLREMLGQQGLQLGQADVGQRQAQQQGSDGQSATFAGASEGSEAANDAGWTRGPAVRASRGLLDEYA